MNIPPAIVIPPILFLLSFPAMTFAAGPSPDPTTALALDINRFALALYPHSGPPDANLIFSPYSIHLALDMTAAGARGDTLTQMQSLLYQPNIDPAPALFAAGDLMDRLQSSGTNSTPILKTANALWAAEAQPGFTTSFNPDFLNRVEKQFRARFAQLDFSDPEPARKTINDWVAAQTNDKILDLIPRGGIQPHLTRLILTNAVYFKADWLNQFQSSSTGNGPFHVPAITDPVQTPIMHRTGPVAYMENDSLQAIEMPYVGENLAMLVLLPKTVDGLPKLESSLSEDLLADVDQKLLTQRVAISLPKFKFKQTIDLVSPLTTLGMNKPFDPRQADFSGMDGQRDLYITGVVHQAFVAVDEQGTEAAAATGIMVGTMAIPMPPPLVFNADHPFLFLIRDKQTGLILFIGRVLNPAAE